MEQKANNNDTLGLSSDLHPFRDGKMRNMRFYRYTVFVLGFNILVILWGAYVRATGSGAGCGSHWPLCDGEILPRSPAMDTMIELTHRISSGTGLILVVVMVVWAFRLYPRQAPVRSGAVLSLLFILLEALIGAGLVLFELVADNTSLMRALAGALHLANTYLLLGALALTGWWSRGGLRFTFRKGDVRSIGLLAGLVAVLIIGMSGAIAALGDTLFPPSTLTEAFTQDFSSSAHLLVRLRWIHPAIAIVASIYLFVLSRILQESSYPAGARKMAALLAGLLMVQLAAGALNVVLLAPVWMQLVHLGLSDLIWISLVILTALVLQDPGPSL